MKNLVVLLITVFAFQFSQAQYRTDVVNATPEMEQKAKKQAKMLTKKLALSDEQPVMVENKLLEFMVKRDEILQTDLSKDDKTRRIKALKMNRLAEMKEILTQPQYDQLLVLEEKQRERSMQKMKAKKKKK